MGYDVPKSYQELLDPKWKGQIVIPSPRTSGTAYMINYSFLQLYGEKAGWEYLEKLDENVAFYTKSGNAPTELVGRGEYLLGIGADENVLKRIKDGYPLQWTVPVEGIGYEGNYCTILKGTKKLELAKKVMDYLGSEEISKFLGSMGYIPPRAGSVSALYGEVQPTFIKLDQAWAVKNKRTIVKQWKSKFLRRGHAKQPHALEEAAKKVAEEKKAAAKQ